MSQGRQYILTITYFAFLGTGDIEDKNCEKNKKALQKKIENEGLMDATLPNCDENGTFCSAKSFKTRYFIITYKNVLKYFYLINFLQEIM